MAVYAALVIISYCVVGHSHRFNKKFDNSYILLKFLPLWQAESVIVSGIMLYNFAIGMLTDSINAILHKVFTAPTVKTLTR